MVFMDLNKSFASFDALGILPTPTWQKQQNQNTECYVAVGPRYPREDPKCL